VFLYLKSGYYILTIILFIQKKFKFHVKFSRISQKEAF
jgi:hypothetical protein